MNIPNVKIVLVCHNIDIVTAILADDMKQNFHIIFVGNNPISDELYTNNRITIARNLPNNIESEKELLTFTAWYAIVKNNLFIEYDEIFRILIGTNKIELKHGLDLIEAQLNKWFLTIKYTKLYKIIHGTWIPIH